MWFVARLVVEMVDGDGDAVGWILLCQTRARARLSFGV